MRRSRACSQRNVSVSGCPVWLRGVFSLGAVLVALSSFLPATARGQVPDVVGTWEWAATSVYGGGEGGYTYTPETEGYTIQQEFRPDSILVRYQNELSDVSAPYTAQSGQLSSGALWGMDSGDYSITGIPGSRTLRYHCYLWQDIQRAVWFAERLPIRPLGACCFGEGYCVIGSTGACQAASGAYMGDDTTCEPDPCQPTPVQSTTWGRIRASYR